jgi:hypothetical protein
MSLADVYGAFVDYYGNIELGLIRSEQGYDIYSSKVSSGLSMNRYIFVVVPSKTQQSYTSLGSETVYLNDLNWVSFQTRTTDDNYPVPILTHFVNPDKKTKLPDDLNVVNRTTETTEFSCASLPVKVQLMHEIKKNNVYQYPDKCKFYQALETFNCVVEIF